MSIYLVSYDLRAPGRNYQNLHNYLDSFPSWAKPLESVWLIETSLTAVQLRDGVFQHVDANDQVFVVDVTKQPTAWRNLGAKVVEWINSKW